MTAVETKAAEGFFRCNALNPFRMTLESMSSEEARIDSDSSVELDSAPLKTAAAFLCAAKCKGRFGDTDAKSVERREICGYYGRLDNRAPSGRDTDCYSGPGR